MDNTFNTTPSSDFTFYDFAKTSRATGKFISVSMPQYVCISNDVRAIAKEKGLTHLRMSVNNLTGEVFLVFTKDAGLDISAKMESRNFCLQRRDIATTIMKLANVPEGETKAHINLSDDLSNSPAFATFRFLNY